MKWSIHVQTPRNCSLGACVKERLGGGYDRGTRLQSPMHRCKDIKTEILKGLRQLQASGQIRRGFTIRSDRVGSDRIRRGYTVPVTDPPEVFMLGHENAQPQEVTCSTDPNKWRDNNCNRRQAPRPTTSTHSRGLTHRRANEQDLSSANLKISRKKRAATFHGYTHFGNASPLLCAWKNANSLLTNDFCSISVLFCCNS